MASEKNIEKINSEEKITMENKIKLGIIFGGKSGEHEVSLQSAASVIRVVNKDKYELVFLGITKDGEWKIFDGSEDAIEDGSWEAAAEPFNPGDIKKVIDFALPIIHGPNCEDGKLQGFFETMDIPYGGCGVLASAVAMDKLLARDVFIKNGLPMCKHVGLFRSEYEQDAEAAIAKVEDALGYPNFVKPANLGSSVGISKAHNREELVAALDLAFSYDKRVIVEEFVNCRELETAILGNENPQAAVVGEILPSEEFYDYKAKYLDDGASKLCIPAQISEETSRKIREYACRAYSAIDGEGFARVDFFIDKDSGKIYLNEINTIPGFTKISMFPKLWEAAGVKYQDTIERIIELGYERYNAKNNR